MITLIGTGHVFDLRSQIRSILDEMQPDIVCVELDKKRYSALMQRKEGGGGSRSKSQRNASFLYRLLGRFQDSIAAEYGVQAGDEMLTGIEFAREYQLPIAFIDVPADRMFARMIGEMSFVEKFRLVISALGSIFVSKKRVDKEIDKIEMNLEKYLDQVGDKFPTIKRVLLDERNQHMVNQLSKAHDEFEQVVAIVGDGHLPGLKRLLEEKNIQVDTIRLKELRHQKKIPTNPSSASFSVEYKRF